jgi:hypothetical protein
MFSYEFILGNWTQDGILGVFSNMSLVPWVTSVWGRLPMVVARQQGSKNEWEILRLLISSLTPLGYKVEIKIIESSLKYDRHGCSSDSKRTILPPIGSFGASVDLELIVI